MDQFLEDLHNSVNQYSPSNQCMVLQCHTWVQKFHCYEIFRLHTETNLKKLPLVRFQRSIKEKYPQLTEKTLKTCLSFPPT